MAFSTSSGYLDCEDLRVVSVVDRKEVQVVGRRCESFFEFFKDYLFIIYFQILFKQEEPVVETMV